MLRLTPSLSRVRTAVLALVLIGSALAPARAQTNLEESSAVLVPADAGFYSAMFRTREQWDMMMSSKAMASIRQNPFVQSGLFLLRSQWNESANDGVRAFKEMLEGEENQQLLSLLKEAVSREIFLYGDASLAQLALVANSLNSRIQAAQAEALQNGENPDQYILETMMRLFLERGAEINTPRFVIGMRIDDRQTAAEQVARLHQLAQQLPNLVPQLQGRIRKQSLNGGEYVTLQVDGSLLPWNEMEDAYDGDIELFGRFRDSLIRKTVSISVGVRGSYLLISCGPNDEHLATLGQGPSLLSVKEMGVVKKNADRKLTSVSYVSGSMLEKLGSMEGQAENFRNSLGMGLSAIELDADIQEKILDRVGDLFDQLITSTPKPGTTVGFEFMTDRGYETYGYNWSENLMLDDSEPLTILQHVGGKPVFMAAGNAKRRPGEYEKSRELVRGLIDAANEAALSKLEGDDKAKYEQLRDAILPLLKRLDVANRELLGPAFQDGQSAFVIDFQMKSAQPQNMLPAASPALPVPELAIVCSIADAQKLKRGVAEYFAVAQKIADVLHDAEPAQIPAIKIPQPQRTEDALGELFAYPLPEFLGLDENIEPTGGLTSDVVVFAFSAETAKRAMKSTPPTLGGLLSDPNQKLAGAAYCDFAAFIDAITAWSRYGFALATQGTDGPIDVTNSVLPFEDILQVLKCYRGMTSVTYREGDAWVTHAEHVFEDLP